MDQKLSEVEMRMMRLSGKPVSFFQIACASSSSENTVTVSLSGDSPNSLVIRFQASGIARSLK